MKSNDLKTKLKLIRKPISSKTRGFKKNVQEYMVDSTFHGLNYVGDTKLSLTERCSLSERDLKINCITIILADYSLY